VSRNGDDETPARPPSVAPCQTTVMWLRITEGFALSPKHAAAAACLMLQVWVVSVQAAGSTEKHLEAARLELQRRSDADSLAAAGVLTAQHNRSQALALVSKAADAAPERADLVWLQLMLCQQAPSCDSEALEQRLRHLDPSNGAAWMGALLRAGAARDDAAIAGALAGLSQSDRTDIYWTTLMGRLSGAAGRSGKVSGDEAVVAVTGLLAAQIIPAYTLVSRSCKADAPEALERCRGIARSFQRGDTFITEMIGVAIAKRVWPAGSPEWKAADKARRLYDYRSKLWLEVEGRPTTRSTKRLLALCSEYRREQDVFRQQIVDAGRNPDPPGGT
jgi:hypothetical protein